MSVSVTKDLVSKVLKSMEALTLQDVLVGVPAVDAEREDGDPASNALIGYIMEFGSPANNVPARPTLVPGVVRVQNPVAERLRKAAVAAMSMDPATVERQLKSAGIEASTSVKALINSNIPPALADSTLESRAARGITRTNTLVDTAQFRNSITYVLRRN